MSAKAAAGSKCYWGVFPRHRNCTPKHCIQRLTGKVAMELEAEPKLHCKFRVAPVLSYPDVHLSDGHFQPESRQPLAVFHALNNEQ